VQVDARRDAGEWIVAVRDNGIGIPADQRSRVFEMFARVQPGGVAGHGVGLSTCERIVTRHGGRIWADEAPGGGTIVSFTLPDA
jgi:signal transduction histidine kinase